MQNNLSDISFKMHAYISFEECKWHGEILKERINANVLRSQESAWEGTCVHFRCGIERSGVEKVRQGLTGLMLGA